MSGVSLFTFAHGKEHAASLASALSIPISEIAVHRFPDGETRIAAPGAAATSIVYCPLDHPNERLVELMFASDALRRGGARRLVLVAPYLCYMRQDKAFHEGEAVSQQAMARFLSACFDRIVTVDTHLHRVARIEDVFPDIEAQNLTAADLIAAFAREQGLGPDVLVAGPDEESIQWARRVGDALGAEAIAGRKTRHGDRNVEIDFPDCELAGRTVLLLDDIVSSGGTVLTAISKLKERGAALIHLAVTHALFDEAMERRLHAAGAASIWSSTSVPHSTNSVSLAPVLAESLRGELVK
ncbi:MAG: ribose-phosphate diphosphokinase [Alphaproteobacteria bacterium]|nr:ribose-phosphate diphosphokinase [Alphaproteobacteria bacterium]MDX5416194.1 ribose-phosphate diphosphokinase [Alphaproteobacteria bacterium]MDX5493525.1 ribose-phosphate diphosphokinase [Alphaproteobacteria bacterium]